MICVFALAMVGLVSFIVMTLWNAILPQVTSASPINFWQAAGLLILCKILFGGFGGWRRGHHPQWKRGMFDKWKTMTPEERDEFRQSMKSRCGWGPFSNTSARQTGQAGAE